MKKLKKLLLLITFVALMTTGCGMKEHIGLKIMSNKEMAVELLMAMDDEMIDAMINMQNTGMDDTEGEDEAEEPAEEATQPAITDEMRWEYVREMIKDIDTEGASVEQYTKDTYKGYLITKKAKSIDEFTKSEASKRTTISDDIEEDSVLFVKKGDVYKSNISFQSEELSDTSSYQQYGVLFDVKFIVTLPNKSISNNATSVSDDGLTLTWDLTKAKDIDFEFKFGSSSSISDYLPFIIGGAALLIIIVIVVILLSKKKKAPVAPVQNGPVQDMNQFAGTNPQAVNYMNNQNQQFNNVNQEVNNGVGMPQENVNQGFNNPQEPVNNVQQPVSNVQENPDQTTNQQ